MGLIIDTDVFILAERSRAPVNLARYADLGESFISAVTASELLAGVYRAGDPAIRARRTAFVEGLLAALPVLPLDLEAARVHAQMVSQIPAHETVGAHDALIAATALRHGHAVLTHNGKDFRRLPGVTVVDYTPPDK